MGKTPATVKSEATLCPADAENQPSGFDTPSLRSQPALQQQLPGGVVQGQPQAPLLSAYQPTPVTSTQPAMLPTTNLPPLNPQPQTAFQPQFSCLQPAPQPPPAMNSAPPPYSQFTPAMGDSSGGGGGGMQLPPKLLPGQRFPSALGATMQGTGGPPLSYQVGAGTQMMNLGGAGHVPPPPPPQQQPLQLGGLPPSHFSPSGPPTYGSYGQRPQ